MWIFWCKKGYFHFRFKKNIVITLVNGRASSFMWPQEEVLVLYLHFVIMNLGIGFLYFIKIISLPVTFSHVITAIKLILLALHKGL
jgi:hypothetical protein